MRSRLTTVAVYASSVSKRFANPSSHATMADCCLALAAGGAAGFTAGAGGASAHALVIRAINQAPAKRAMRRDRSMPFASCLVGYAKRTTGHPACQRQIL